MRDVNRMTCLTVRQLIALLKRMPQEARVRFLDTDDPDRAACDVEHVETVKNFEKSLGHGDAALVVREAGLKHGQVVIQGVTR